MRTPRQIAEKWSRNLAANSESVKIGVQSVTVAPGQKAAARKEQYVQGVNRSADIWARRVGAVQLGDWQTAMIVKGLPRMADGSRQAVTKVERFWTSFGPWLDQGKSMVDQMPRGDFETNMQRAYAMARHNHEYKLRGG